MKPPSRRRVDDTSQPSETRVCLFFFFQAEDGIRDLTVTGVQTCALPISVPVFEVAEPSHPRDGPRWPAIHLEQPALYRERHHRGALPRRGRRIAVSILGQDGRHLR